jgi:monooxygenase
LSFGAVDLSCGGRATPIPDRVAYKGMMLDGVPNLAFAIGYTNNSWTLKVDLVAAYVVRVLAFMREKGYAVVTPTLPADGMATSPFIDMTSGYFERSRASLPRQGDRAPWRLWQHYFKDAALYRGQIDQQNLRFSPARLPDPVEVT